MKNIGKLYYFKYAVPHESISSQLIGSFKVLSHTALSSHGSVSWAFIETKHKCRLPNKCYRALTTNIIIQHIITHITKLLISEDNVYM